MEYYKEQQELNNQSFDSSYCTAVSSSKTTSSYRTARENSSEIFSDQDTSKEKCFNEEIVRYKRNALVSGVLRDLQYNVSDERSSESSAELLDASQTASDINNKLNNPSVKDDAEELRNVRLKMGKFIISEEDNSVVKSALFGVSTRDEMKNLRLTRKGTEITQTSREYFLGLDDDDFEFVKG